MAYSFNPYCTRSASGRFLWPLVVVLWSSMIFGGCSLGHIPIRLMQMFCCKFSNLISDINDKYIYPWRSKCNSALNQVQLIAGNTQKVIWHIWRHRRLQNRSRQCLLSPHRIALESWARCHCVCLIITHQLICNMTCLGPSSDQVIWPDLRSGFQIGVQG